jgi:hypothetical protein
MRRSLIVVLVLSLLFAFFFAVGGAGIYGSPFAPVPPNWPSREEHDRNRLLMALTILVGPLACGAALAAHRRSPRLACVLLVIGAIAGALLGTATNFVHVWETVFLIMVWLPMTFVAAGIGLHPRRS